LLFVPDENSDWFLICGTGEGREDEEDGED